MALNKLLDPNLDVINQPLATTSNVSFNKVTVTGSVTSSDQLATKAYVDDVAAGINFHEAVHVATDSLLFAMYDNGASGVGATLTGLGFDVLPTIDGETCSVTQRILVRAQTIFHQNGIYVVTNVGNGTSQPWVLTRASDADTSGELDAGDFCFVLNGSTYGGSGFINISTSPINIGNTSVSYTLFSVGETITAGNGLYKTGTTIHVNTASTSRLVINADDIDLATVSRNNTTGNSGNSFIQSFTTDSYGRVTGSVLANVASARDTEVKLLMEVI